jgi:hypothetical protein
MSFLWKKSQLFFSFLIFKFFFCWKHHHNFYLWMICHLSNFTKLKRNTLVQKVQIFFFPQLYDISQTNDHLQEDLAKFGYRKKNVKVIHF